MNLFILSSFIFLITTMYYANKSTISAYFKKSLLPLMAIVFIACLIIYPKISVTSASKGIKLWLEVVFPSLFPFFVASQLLSKSGLVSVFGVILEPVMRPLFNVPGCSSFALAMGIVSGYPVGASITTDLRKEKLITKTEAERLLTFTNNSGPLFIMGAIAVGMFNQPKLGYLLYISHVAASLTVGFIFRYYKRRRNITIKSNKDLLSNFKLELKKFRNSDVNPWTRFGECIKNAISTILSIGGFIIFFSVLINIMLSSGFISYLTSFLPFGCMDTGTIDGLICGVFEITTGANIIKLTASSLIIKLCCVSLIIGWAGFSVHMQVMSIVSTTDISVKPYLIGKALQGIFASAYTFIGFKIFSSVIQKESAVFANSSGKNLYIWGDMLKTSIQYILITSIIMIIVTIIFTCASNILSKKRLF